MQRDLRDPKIYDIHVESPMLFTILDPYVPVKHCETSIWHTMNGPQNMLNILSILGLY